MGKYVKCNNYGMFTHCFYLTHMWKSTENNMCFHFCAKLVSNTFHSDYTQQVTLQFSFKWAKKLMQTYMSKYLSLFKIQVFWVVMPCQPINTYRYLQGQTIQEESHQESNCFELHSNNINRKDGLIWERSLKPLI